MTYLDLLATAWSVAGVTLYVAVGLGLGAGLYQYGSPVLGALRAALLWPILVGVYLGQRIAYDDHLDAYRRDEP